MRRNALLAAFALAGAPLCADSFFVQMPPNVTLLLFSDSAHAFVIADNFVLTQRADIIDVRVWGAAIKPGAVFSPDLDGIASFDITFYKDIAGLPGDTIYSATIPTTSPAIAAADSPGVFPGTHRLTFKLPADVRIEAGDQHWLTVRANLVPGEAADGWAWVDTDSGSDNQFALRNPEWQPYVDSESDLSFELLGRVATDCPFDKTTTNTNPGDKGFGIPDASLDGADLSFYVEGWLADSQSIADITSTNTNPGEPGYGIADDLVDGADLSFYVEGWLDGCF